MVTLRLFHQTAPFRQLEARALEEGVLTIGRDPEAGWTIEDPELAVSRQHCELALRDGLVLLTDTSANGVFVGRERARAPAHEATVVALGESFRLGPYMILVDPSAATEPALGASEPATAAAPRDRLDGGAPAFDAPFTHPVLQAPEIGREALAVPADWDGPAAPPPARPAARSETAAAMLDAFCEGARLDASTFAGDDPLEVMKRLGGVYQQMVLGLGDLMNERTTVKAEYRMDRTTVGAEANNPFKWATPQRVAVDLLRAGQDEFLSGPHAVRASFEDMKKHLLCVLAGLRAALGATLDQLDPVEVADKVRGRSFVMRNRDAALWGEYVHLYSDLRAQAGDNPDSQINRGFRAGYEARLRELDALVAPV